MVDLLASEARETVLLALGRLESAGWLGDRRGLERDLDGATSIADLLLVRDDAERLLDELEASGL